MLYTLNKAKSVAKKLHKSLVVVVPVPLSKVQEVVARVWGFKDWHHLHQVMEAGTSLPITKDLEGRLRSELIELGAKNDAKKLLALVSSSMFPETLRVSRSDGKSGSYETPTLLEIKALAAALDPGELLVVCGPGDSGKSAVARTLARKRERGVKQQLVGVSIRIDLHLHNTALQVVDSVLEAMTGSDVRSRSTDVALLKLKKAFEDVRPSLVVLDAAERLGSSGPHRTREIGTALAAMVEGSGCPWVLFAADRREGDPRGVLDNLLAVAPDLEKRVSVTFSMPALSAESLDLKALAQEWESELTGGNTRFFENKANLQRLYDNAFGGSHYCVMKMLDIMSEYLKREGTNGTFEGALEYASVEEKKRKDGWAEVRENRKDANLIAGHESCNAPRKTKFEMINVIDLMSAVDNRGVSVAEGRRFYVRLHGIDFTLRFSREVSRPNLGSLSIVAENADRERTARLRCDDGVLIASPSGSPAALHVDFEFDRLGISESHFRGDPLASFSEVRDAVAMMVRQHPRKSVAEDRLAQLRAAVELVADACALQGAWVNWATPVNGFAFGSQYADVRRLPVDVTHSLTNLFWREFEPEGWQFGGWQGRHHLRALETSSFRKVIKPRASESNIRLRAERRLAGCSRELIDVIVDLVNLPL